MAMSRSENMSRIRGKDTGPELTVRRALHGQGFRYRLHARDLPGKPDIVLPRWGAIIQVHGCFWHGHEGCAPVPKTRQEFWLPKISANHARDGVVMAALLEKGWRLLVIWECSLVGPRRWEPEALTDAICDWITRGGQYAELSGEARPGSAGPAGS